MSFTYDFPRPCVTVDILLFHQNEILLIKRLKEPFKDQWALPGGFVDMDEDLLDAALRELSEETGIYLTSLQQFKTYGTPNRDPRHRTISVVYSSRLLNEKPTALAGDDAAEAEWFSIHLLPNLAFDHSKIITDWLNAMRLDAYQ